MTIRIRSLAPEDKPRWEVLWLGYRKFYESVPGDGVTENLWRWLMNKDEDPHCFVAVDENENVVGIVHYLFQRTTFELNDRIYLQDLFVDSAARGKGAGRALIEAVYGVAESTNACEVYWMTQHFNDTARRLYDEVATLTPFIKYTKKFP